MTGPHDSIIGMEREPSLARFLTGLPSKFEPATGNPRLNGVVVEADDKTGRATKITRISYSAQELRWTRSSTCRSRNHRPRIADLRGPRRSSKVRAARASVRADRPEPRRVLSVSELTGRIRTLLEERFIEIWVEGELSNCRMWNTGHMYFTLKDANAQIKGVMFRSAIRYLRFKPQDGLRVVARGRVSVYDPKGEYQIVCEHLEPEGLGARQLAFDQLKERLAREGLFDERRKRALPALPRKIGVVTSLDGAAVRDIIKVLRRRYAERAHRHSPGARAGRRRRARDRARDGRHRQGPRRRRGHRRPRRRIDRGSLGVQRRSRGACDCRLSGADDLRRRPRDRRHHRRLRRGSARADAVGGRGDGRRAQGRLLRRGSIGSVTASRRR